MSTSTTHLPSPSSCVLLRGSQFSLPSGLGHSILRPGLTQGLSSARPWKSIGRNNTFSGSRECDRALCLKALMGPHSLQGWEPRFSSSSPSTWYVTLIRKTFMMLGKSLLIQGNR